MAKYYGKIGYMTPVETAPGVWDEIIIERDYYGDVLKNRLNMQYANVTADISINTQISVIADQFDYEHCHAIRYITYLNQKWKVTSMEIRYPRLILDIGGMYHG